MDQHSITFSLELKDHQALTAYLCAPMKKQSRVLGLLGGSAAALLIIAVGSFVHSFRDFVIGVLFACVLLTIVAKLATARVQRQLAPLPGRAVLCERRMTLASEGIELQANDFRTVTGWQGVLAIDETPAHVFFRIDSIAAYTVPKRVFSTPAALRSFVEAAREQHRRGLPR